MVCGAAGGHSHAFMRPPSEIFPEKNCTDLSTATTNGTPVYCTHLLNWSSLFVITSCASCSSPEPLGSIGRAWPGGECVEDQKTEHAVNAWTSLVGKHTELLPVVLVRSPIFLGCLVDAVPGIHWVHCLETHHSRTDPLNNRV